MSNFKFLLLPALMLLAGSAMAGSATITSLTPNTADSSGGQQIIIRGTKFLAANNGVGAINKVVFKQSGVVVATFSGAFTVSTDTRLSFILPATVPAGIAGGADIDLLNNAASVLTALNGGLGATPFTFTGNQLQINARATIASVISVTWGTNTVNDSANVIQKNTAGTYSWVIGSSSSADAPNAILSLGTSYKLSDDYHVTITNTSTTGNAIDLFAKAADPTDWQGVAVGSTGPANKYSMGSTITTLNGTGVQSAALSLTPPGANQEYKAAGPVDMPLAVGGEDQIDLNFTSPTSITAGADTPETIVVTITALKD